jgi:hypothetical protein
MSSCQETLDLDAAARKCIAHVYRLLLQWAEESVAGSDDPGQEKLPAADDAPASDPCAYEAG